MATQTAATSPNSNESWVRGYYEGQNQKVEWSAGSGQGNSIIEIKDASGKVIQTMKEGTDYYINSDGKAMMTTPTVKAETKDSEQNTEAAEKVIIEKLSKLYDELDSMSSEVFASFVQTIGADAVQLLINLGSISTNVAASLKAKQESLSSKIKELGLSGANEGFSFSSDGYYSSMDDVARAFAAVYADEARSRQSTFNGDAVLGQEVGAYIISIIWVSLSKDGESNVNTMYKYGTVFWGEHNTVVWELLPNLFLDTLTNASIGYTFPMISIAGMVHIHPNCECHDNDIFSYWDYIFGDFTGLPIYVVTPAEGIKKYVPGNPDILLE